MFKKIYIFVIGFLLATVAYLQPYRLVVVVGDSMFPTYKSGQILLATRATEIKKDDVVVVLFHDHGSRYVAKMFNDDWMRKMGYKD